MTKELKRPQIRFEGFNDDWEQRNLNDTCTFEKGRGYSKADIATTGMPLFLYGRMYTNYQLVVKSADTYTTLRKGSLVSQGGEVVIPASGEDPKEIAIASHIALPGMLLGADLNVLHPDKVTDATYLALALSNGQPHLDLIKLAQGKSVVHIHCSDIAKINVRLPDFREQQMIANLFVIIDHLITLHQRKLAMQSIGETRWRKLKKTLSCFVIITNAGLKYIKMAQFAKSP